MASQWLDFRALKAQVSIRDVLAHYDFLNGLQEKKPGKLVGSCPIHGGGNATSLNVDVKKNVFHCFSRCGGGNVLDLVMLMEECSIREAGEKLAEWFDLTFHKTPQPPEHSAKVSQKTARAAATHTSRDGPTEPVNRPLARPLANLKHDHPYLSDRGLTVATITHFGAGSASRGLMRGRIAIPIHNTVGELVAYAGRAVAEELAREKGKYRLPNGFQKSHVVFNLHRAREHAADGLIVVEGFFDCMKVHQAGFSNVVALMGSTLSDEQAELLVDNAERLVLMFDGDDAGREGERTCYRMLRTQLFLKSVHLKDREQPDTHSEDRLRELLS